MYSRGIRSWAAAVLLFIGTWGAAQGPGTGGIRGTIVDPAGRAVENADVSVTEITTQAVRLLKTDSNGIFRAPLLAPGDYRVEVLAAGFKRGTIPSVHVIVSETATVELALAIESATARVDVLATRDMADVESSTLGRAVEENAIVALPLSNRNFTQILSLSPGIVVGLPDATMLGRGTQNVTANGSKTTANNVQFNGVDANNLAQNSAAADSEEVGVAVPAPDTIQEFKVQTGNYDATYGRGTGANVDVVSRTGTNQFHGTAWEFLRNDLLNANDFFSKLTAQPRPVLKQNQFGLATGGPILRDRLFFFAGYQGLRSSNGEGDEVTATLPQLTDDRSATTLGAQFCAYPTAAGGAQVACDGSNINSVALKLLNFKLANGKYAIPSPQVAVSSDSSQIPIGVSTYTIPAQYRENQYTLNLDAVLTPKNTLSGRGFYSQAPTVEPFSPNAANVPGWGTNELDKNTMLILGDTHVVSSNLVNVARVGYMRFGGISAVNHPISTADLGVQSPIGLIAPDLPAPGITVDGLFTVGDAGTPSQMQKTNSYIVQDMISYMQGRQFFRGGAEIKRHQIMVDAPFSSTGLLDVPTFNDFLLGQSAQQNGSPSGLSNVNISNGSSGDFRKDERYTDFAAFLQDDIRLTPRLTVNAGLRYEVFGPPSEIHGKLVTFDPTIATFDAPGTGTYSGFVVASNFSELLPQGVVRAHQRGLWPTHYGDLSPRVGFAYRLTTRHEVVLRGGYGIYFDRLSGGLAENLVGQPPFSTFQFLLGSQNGGATLQAPFTPLLPESSAYPIFAARIPGGGPTVVGLSTHMRDPYTAEYNANLQFSLGGNMLGEVGYVGTRSLHVAGCNELNQSLLASPKGPVNGETSNSVSNVVQRVPYAGIAPGSLECQTAYNANYNSLQASLTRRWSAGLQLLASYTYGRSLDETSGSSGSGVFELWLLTNDQNSPRGSYGPTDFDRTHRGVLSFTYELPQLRRAGRVLRAISSSWKAAGILVAQSGTPITILDFGAGAVYGNYPFENRAQLSGQRVTTRGSLHQRVLGQYLDPAGFTSAPEAPNGTSAMDTDFGNSGVGLVRGPGQRNIDFAMEKSVPTWESQTIHLRAEFFNLTNTPNFANPNNSVSFGPSFGKITSKSNNPRIVQLALKYQF